MNYLPDDNMNEMRDPKGCLRLVGFALGLITVLGFVIFS